MDPKLQNINNLLQTIYDLQEQLAISDEILNEVFEDSDAIVLGASLIKNFMTEEEIKWIQKAIKKQGSLQESVKNEVKLPLGKLEEAAHKGGKSGKRARLALTLRKMEKHKKNLKESAELKDEREYLSKMLGQEGMEPQKAEAIKTRIKQIDGMLSPTQGGQAPGKYYTKTVEGTY